MENSHWDAAIHFGVQLAQYCDIGSGNGFATSRFLNLRRPSSLTHICGSGRRWVLSTSANALWHVSHLVLLLCIWSDMCTSFGAHKPCCFFFASFAIQINVSTANVISTYIDQWITIVCDNEKCYLYGNKFDLTWLDLTWLVIKPYLVTLFHGNRPLCAPLP